MKIKKMFIGQVVQVKPKFRNNGDYKVVVISIADEDDWFNGVVIDSSHSTHTNYSFQECFDPDYFKAVTKNG